MRLRSLDISLLHPTCVPVFQFSSFSGLVAISLSKRQVTDTFMISYFISYNVLFLMDQSRE